MKKDILTTLVLCSGIITPVASHAVIIQLLEDDLQMYTKVYSEGHPGTVTHESSYSGSLFNFPSGFSISSNGEIPCQDPVGASDHQWATAYAESNIDDTYFYVNTSSGWSQTCNATYDWGNKAAVDLDLKFKVIREGQSDEDTYKDVFVYLDGAYTSISLFDHTLGEEIEPGSAGGPYFHLGVNHTYTLAVDVAGMADQDSLPYDYRLDAKFVAASISPVPEPSTLILFGIGLSGLLFKKTST